LAPLGDKAIVPPESARRPRHLFSALIACGACADGHPGQRPVL